MNKGAPAFTVNHHFVGKDPIVRDIYDQLKKAIKRFDENCLRNG